MLRRAFERPPSLRQTLSGGFDKRPPGWSMWFLAARNTFRTRSSSKIRVAKIIRSVDKAGRCPPYPLRELLQVQEIRISAIEFVADVDEHDH
jgi:hypothetical protein